jgi:hypothetical protein
LPPQPFQKIVKAGEGGGLVGVAVVVGAVLFKVEEIEHLAWGEGVGESSETPTKTPGVFQVSLNCCRSGAAEKAGPIRPIAEVPRFAEQIFPAG